MHDPKSRSPRRQRMTQRLATLLVYASLAALLFPLIPPAPLPGSGSASDSGLDTRPGSGITVNAQVADVWLAQAWIDAARRDRPALTAAGDEELGRVLGLAQAPRIVYAFTLRASQANGGTATLGFVRDLDPGRDPTDEFLEVLRAAVGQPPRRTSLDFSDARIHAVPGAASRHDLLTAIGNLSGVADHAP